MGSASTQWCRIRSRRGSGTRKRLIVVFAAALLGSGVIGVNAQASPLTFGGDLAGPETFQVTVFASGLPYPYGIAELPDGSLLVGINEATGGSYFGSVGALVRFTDEDDDGVADGPPVSLVTGLPGAMSAVRVAGDLVFAVDTLPGDARISVLRLGETPDAPLEPIGTMAFNYADQMEHGTYGIAAAEVEDEPGQIDLFFNVGSIANDAAGGAVRVSGLTSGTLHDASIYRVRLDDRGATLTASVPEQIASGLRNAAGLAIDARTGDLWFEDNGIDTPDNRIEALSADELDHIPAAAIGDEVEDFGFPGTSIDYRSGEVIGPGATAPFASFVPTNGSENEGAADIALAPRAFPGGLNDGVFVGFHGQWDEVGLDNEENPVAFVDRETGAITHVVSNDEPLVGHLDGLLATREALYLVDMTGTGSLVGTAATGVIYRVAPAE